MKTPEIVDIKGVLQYLLEHDHDDWRWCNREGSRYDSSDPFLCHRIEQMYVQRNLISRVLMRRACEFILNKIKPEATLAGYNAKYAGLVIGVESDRWPEIRREYLKVWIEELSAAKFEAAWVGNEGDRV